MVGLLDSAMMANPALTLTQLSIIGLSAGIDVGFNAVEVERWCDPETFDLRLAFKFGDQQQMRRPRLRTPSEWALSYAEDAECTRERRIIEMPNSIVDDAGDTLKRHLVEKLLEVT